MIMAMIAGYLVILHLIFNVFKLVDASNRNKIIVTVVGVIGISLFWYVVTFNQPQSNELVVYRTTTQMVPRVTGRVIEVAVQRNEPMNKGDVLFKIDPRPYRYTLERLEAEYRLASVRLEQATILAERNAGPVFDVQQRQAQVDSLNAQIAAAKLNLEETTVYAPSNGYVTAMTLQPGFIASPARPALNFIDTDRVFIGANFKQQSLEKARVGDPIEAALDRFPGKIFTGKVGAIVEASGAGILAPSAPVPTSSKPAAHPRFFVRVAFDDTEFVKTLPPGASGAVAIYSSAGWQATAMIRRVAIRFYTFFNYILPDG